MSGIDAVKNIVETEGQARRIVDEAAAKAQRIVSEAREQAEQILDTYKRLSEERKAAAISKAVELILNA